MTTRPAGPLPSPSLDAYAAVHERGVLHGDVHAGNVLLRPDGTVTLIDFGLAQVSEADGARAAPAPRAGGGEGLDPACARALLHGEGLPPLDAASEQYAIATLAHRVLTSTSYLDLACEREEALRRITADAPRRFAAVGVVPWPSGERVLHRALAKSPASRFTSTTALRDALVAATGLGRAAHASDRRPRQRRRRSPPPSWAAPSSRSTSTARSGRAPALTRRPTRPGSSSASRT